MNIFMHELRAYRKSTIIWTISLIMIVLLFMSFYSSFAKDAAGIYKNNGRVPRGDQEFIRG